MGLTNPGTVFRKGSVPTNGHIATWAGPVAIQDGGAGGGGTPASPSTSVQFNNSGSFGGSQRLEWDGTSLLLGHSSDATGSLKFNGTTSGTVSLSVADAAGTWTMKLPTSGGTNTYVLTTDGSGNCSWAAPGSTANIVIGTSTITSGTDKRVLYDNAAVVGESSNFTITNSGGDPNVSTSGFYWYGGAVMAYGTGVNPGSLGSGYFTNAFIGAGGNTSLSGTNNFGFGLVLIRLTSGNSNIAIGNPAASFISSGINNIAIGGNALDTETTGGSNIAIGSTAQQNASGNTQCVALGNGVFKSLSGATAAIAISDSNGAQNSGNYGVFIGAYAGGNSSSGDRNCFIGAAAGYGISTGRANTWIGGGNNPAVGATTSSTIVFADGDGNVKLDYKLTNSGQWTFNQTNLGNFSQALTNGAAAQTATLTNAPAAGNPTKWVPINDNGTTRYIPAW